MFGLNEADFAAVKLKIDRQRKFLQDYKFVNSFGEEKSLLSVSKSANFSSTYYAEIANRTNTIHMLSVKHELVPVFLTITLNGCFRKALVGNFATFTTKDIRSLPIEQKQKLNEGVPFTIKDLANVLNYNFHKFTKRFRFAYKGEVFQYIRTFEPHKKDGVPHIHALIYAPKHTIPYLLKIYKDVFYAPQNLRNERLTPAQIANGEINGFQTSINNATGYVMKYITKTFINFNETDDINEVQAWFIKHKIRRFLSSQNPIPLWVYRKINFIKGLRDLGNLNILKDFDNTLIEWDYKSQSIFMSIPYTSEELIYEDGHLLYYVCGRLMHEYVKNINPAQSIGKIQSHELKSIREAYNSDIKPVYYNPYKIFRTAWKDMSDERLKLYWRDNQNEMTDDILSVQDYATLENEMIERGFLQRYKNHIRYFTEHALEDIRELEFKYSNNGVMPYPF